MNKMAKIKRSWTFFLFLGISLLLAVNKVTEARGGRYAKSHHDGQKGMLPATGVEHSGFLSPHASIPHGHDAFAAGGRHSDNKHTSPEGSPFVSREDPSAADEGLLHSQDGFALPASDNKGGGDSIGGFLPVNEVLLVVEFPTSLQESDVNYTPKEDAIATGENGDAGAYIHSASTMAMSSDSKQMEFVSSPPSSPQHHEQPQGDYIQVGFSDNSSLPAMDSSENDGDGQLPGYAVPTQNLGSLQQRGDSNDERDGLVRYPFASNRVSAKEVSNMQVVSPPSSSSPASERVLFGQPQSSSQPGGDSDGERDGLVRYPLVSSHASEVPSVQLVSPSSPTNGRVPANQQHVKSGVGGGYIHRPFGSSLSPQESQGSQQFIPSHQQVVPSSLGAAHVATDGYQDYDQFPFHLRPIEDALGTIGVNREPVNPQFSQPPQSPTTAASGSHKKEVPAQERGVATPNFPSPPSPRLTGVGQRENAATRDEEVFSKPAMSAKKLGARGRLQPTVSGRQHFPSEESLRFSFCEQRYDGFYRHPNDCARIIQCFDHELFEYPSCRHGLAFDEARQVCDYRDKVQACGTGLKAARGTSEKKTECKGGHLHGAHIADPKDCSRFYRCVWGRLEPLRCAKGTVFNPKLDVCDYPSQVPGCEKAGVGVEGNK